MTKQPRIRSIFLNSARSLFSFLHSNRRRASTLARCMAVASTMAVSSVGCLDEWGIDERLFPCRAPEDCSDGFVCDGVRFVCVRPEDASDAGDLFGSDAAGSDAANGEDAGPVDASDAGLTDASANDANQG